eukprot:GEMP01030755.1.p1 GENE.GEMP01030755.1~~GEMP01030755.1.p1  ORF type:complete len:518 (+),score=144.79 GEMP01030755.1:60-1556(+)
MARVLSWLCFSHLALADGGVEVLTKANFDSFIKDTERVLVKFYAPWCGHCKSMAPEFEAAAKQMKDEGLKSRLADVDATVEPELAKRFDVSGYPTLKYFIKGESTEYAGPRQQAGIVTWMRSREQPIMMDITEDEVKDKMEDRSSKFVVVGHMKKDSVRYKVLLSAAERLRDAEKNGPFRFFYVPLAKGKDPKKDASLEFVNHNTNATTKYEKTWNKDVAFKWVIESAYGVVSHYDKDIHTLPFMEEAGFNSILVAVYEKDEEKENLITELDGLAQKNLMYKICYALLSEVSDKDDWGLTTQSGIIILEKEKKFRQLGLEKPQDFITGVDNKKINRYFKSAPADQEEENGVRILTGDNFEKIAFDSKKDVFVEFYAPWCGHCKALTPKWEELAKRIKEKGFGEQITIAKLDATANETVETVDGFPALVLYPAVKRSFQKKEKYSGDREIEPLYDFLLERSANLEDYEDKIATKQGKTFSMVDRELRKKKKLMEAKAEL